MSAAPSSDGGVVRIAALSSNARRAIYGVVCVAILGGQRRADAQAVKPSQRAKIAVSQYSQPTHGRTRSGKREAEMYREYIGDFDLHTIEINCDKCPARMKLAGTQTKEEKHKTFLRFGWRVNSRARHESGLRRD